MRAALTLFLALGLVAAAATARAAPRDVDRPPLPHPFPEIIHGACPGLEDAGGCHFGVGTADETGRSFPRGAVFVRGGDRFAKLHELGHAFDETMMDAGEREGFARLLWRDNELWTWSVLDEQGRLVQVFDTLAEVFADAYAHCRMGDLPGPGRPWTAAYDYFPTARQHRRVCRLIARAGRDAGALVAVDGDR